MSFYSELKRRNVFRVGAAYAVTAWLLIQFAETVFPLFGYGQYPARMVVILAVAGFFPALILAWVYQITVEGFKRDDDTTSDPRSRVDSNRKADFAIIGVLAIAVGLLGYRQFIDQPFFPTVETLPKEITDPVVKDNSVAVLRFANFGIDSSFSDGLSEQVLYLLAGISELSVPSRQFAWSIGDQSIDSKEIANRLGVRYLLEGNVQFHEPTVRVSVRLIDGLSGSQVWSKILDETLSAKNFFQIQEAIADKVVDSLEITYSLGSDRGNSDRGTDNDTALLHYLAGKQALRNQAGETSLSTVIEEFSAAIDADRQFAQAYAGLCEAYLTWYVSDRDVAHFGAAESACIRAIRLNPDLGEVYAALGRLRRIGGQYTEAVADLKKARQLLNDSTTVLIELGRAYRALDNLALAEATFNEAIAKEPRDPIVYRAIANFLYRTGRYRDSLPFYKQELLLNPESASAYSNIGSSFFMLGDFANATAAWNRSVQLNPNSLAYMNTGNSLFYEGQFDRSTVMYRKAIELSPDDSRAWGGLAASCRYTRNLENCATEAYERAIELGKV